MLATAGVLGLVSFGLATAVLATSAAFTEQLGWGALGLLLIGAGIWVFGHSVAVTLFLAALLIEGFRNRWHLRWTIWVGVYLGVSILLVVVFWFIPWVQTFLDGLLGS